MADARLSSGTLQLSGGWRAGFAARTYDPADTVVDAQRVGQPLNAYNFAGTLVVENLTLTGGVASEGGGLKLKPTGSGIARVRTGRIVGNRSERTAGTVEGGG